MTYNRLRYSHSPYKLAIRYVQGDYLEYETKGGSILLDVYSLAAFAQRMESVTYEANLLNGFWAPEKYHGFRNTFKYEAEKVILDKYTIIEPERKRTVYNWLQVFSPEDLASELDECGLVSEEIYSGVSGSPFDPGSNEFAIIAGPKPA
jgi:hypothetical protein